MRFVQRTLFWGMLVALVLGGLLGLVAWYAPNMLLHWFLRAGVAFTVCWILFSVVHRAAKFIGAPCTALVVVLTLAIPFSHHVVFAIHGVPTIRGPGGVNENELWLNPTMMLIVNMPALAAIAFCAYYRHDGSAGGGSIVE